MTLPLEEEPPLALASQLLVPSPSPEICGPPQCVRAWGANIQPAWCAPPPALAPTCCVWTHKHSCMEYFSSVPGFATSMSWKQQRQLNKLTSKTSSSLRHHPGSSKSIAASPTSVISSRHTAPCFNEWLSPLYFCSGNDLCLPGNQAFITNQAHSFVSWAPGKQ